MRVLNLIKSNENRDELITVFFQGRVKNRPGEKIVLKINSVDAITLTKSSICGLDRRTLWKLRRDLHFMSVRNEASAWSISQRFLVQTLHIA